jgi:hypothetical protein
MAMSHIVLSIKSDKLDRQFTSFLQQYLSRIVGVI